MTSDETPNTETMLSFFKLLSDVNRLKVIGLLAIEPRSVEQIAGLLGLPYRQVIRHLSMIVAAGLASTVDDNIYRFEERALMDAARLTLAQAPHVAPGSENLEDSERKVISDFTTADGRLKSLPSQGKKLLTVLRYVNDVFTPGERYPEKQVNQMLKRFNDDTASLRRALVDYRLMAREAGVYWRVDDVLENGLVLLP